VSREHEDRELVDHLVDDLLASLERRPTRHPEPREEDHSTPEEGER